MNLLLKGTQLMPSAEWLEDRSSLFLLCSPGHLHRHGRRFGEISQETQAVPPALAIPGSEPGSWKGSASRRAAPQAVDTAASKPSSRTSPRAQAVVLARLPVRIGEQPHRRAGDVFERASADRDFRRAASSAIALEDRVIDRVRADRHAGRVQPLTGPHIIRSSGQIGAELSAMRFAVSSTLLERQDT